MILKIEWRYSLKRQGLALPLIMGIVVLMLLAIYNLVILSHSEILQSRRTADGHTALYIAKAGYHNIVNQINRKDWDYRFFRDVPYTASNIVFGGGKYNLFIENTPGQEKQADIWIQSEYNDVKRALFYRVKYTETIFDELNKVQPVLVMSVNSDEALEVISGGSSATAAIDELLRQREQNSSKLDNLKEQLGNSNDINQITTSLGVTIEGTVLAGNVNLPSAPQIGMIDGGSVSIDSFFDGLTAQAPSASEDIEDDGGPAAPDAAGSSDVETTASGDPVVIPPPNPDWLTNPPQHKSTRLGFFQEIRRAYHLVTGILAAKSAEILQGLGSKFRLNFSVKRFDTHMRVLRDIDPENKEYYDYKDWELKNKLGRTDDDDD